MKSYGRATARAVFCLVFVVTVMAVAGWRAESGSGPPRVEIINPEDVRPGMKGYGLSVFSGSEIKRFEVEVVDVVPNSLPKQDLIYVMCSGQDLEKSMIIAGMSGSPVWIEGKLAGAVAYGYQYSLDPLAGVTPIRNMLQAMDSTGDIRPGTAYVPSPSWTGLLAAAGGEDRVMRRISTPLITSGFSDAGMAEVEKTFGEYGLMPLAGGGMSSTDLDYDAMDEMRPGAPVGAAMLTGDLSMTAIGTLTWREGDKVVGFGHPFLMGGPVSMPLVSAEIHTVVNTQRVSFKLGSPTAVVGELVLDEQSCIVGHLGKKPEMIPIRVRVKRKLTGFDDEFHYDSAAIPKLTPALLNIAVMESVRSAAPSIDSSSARAHTTLTLDKYGKVEYEDLYAIMEGTISKGFMEPVAFFAWNPFEIVKIKAMDIDVDVTDELNIAFIDSVWTETDEVDPGEKLRVSVGIRPFGRGLEAYHFDVDVPDDPSLRKLSMKVTGGSRTIPDAAPPRGVANMIDLMGKVIPSDHLVISYRTPESGVDIDGTRMKNLPPSVSSAFQPKNSVNARPVSDMVMLSEKTPYVIIGSTGISLDINNGKKKKR